MQWNTWRPLPVPGALEPVLLPSCTQHQPPAAGIRLLPADTALSMPGRERGEMNNSNDQGSLWLAAGTAELCRSIFSTH